MVTEIRTVAEQLIDQEEVQQNPYEVLETLSASTLVVITWISALASWSWPVKVSLLLCTYVHFHLKKKNTNLHKYAVSGILLLYSLIAPSDKEQGDKSVLSERKHSEKLERSP